MSLTCPFCSPPAVIQTTHRLELPPDHRSDEVTLQLLRCPACGVEAAAIYEESRRGAADSVDHFAFRLDELTFARVRRLVEACPGPGDKRCQCRAHQELAGEGAYRLVTERLRLRLT